MAPKLVDKKAKKIAILEAAMKIFAKKGIRNTKIIDIAKVANIGKGTIYEYFKNKEDIFRESFLYYTKELEKTIAIRTFKLTDPEEKLRALITSFVDVIDKQNLDHMEIIFDFWAEGVRCHEENNVFDLKAMYRDWRNLIISILEEGIKQKKFRNIDTTITSSILIGCIDGLIMQWILDKNLYSLKRAVEVLSDNIINGIKKL